MVNIEEYIKLSLEERQEHLRLNESCTFRGIPEQQAVYLKGLLAYILDTTIPLGTKIYLCHACNISTCCNPYHLYWGTPRENALDTYRNGRKSVWDRMVAKYGEQKTRNMYRSRVVSSDTRIKLSEATKKANKKRLANSTAECRSEKPMDTVQLRG